MEMLVVQLNYLLLKHFEDNLLMVQIMLVEISQM
nr:MAG TPA: hypothetical protein [Caudoviricetes sp.]